jgi:small GTP-binding protein
MAYFKLVVTGPFNAGKTALIRAVSEVRGVNTDVDTDQDRHVKPQTTVAMDFGKVTLPDGLTLHLVGTPGQRRFGFMWEVLILECHGILMLVDSSDPASFSEAGEMLDFFAARANGIPIFVVANKQDKPGALSPVEVGRELNLVVRGQHGRVVPLLPPLGCVADDRVSVLETLETIAPYLASNALAP